MGPTPSNIIQYERRRKTIGTCQPNVTREHLSKLGKVFTILERVIFPASRTMLETIKKIYKKVFLKLQWKWENNEWKQIKFSQPVAFLQLMMLQMNDLCCPIASHSRARADFSSQLGPGEICSHILKRKLFQQQGPEPFFLDQSIHQDCQNRCPLKYEYFCNDWAGLGRLEPS
mgnify:CR=1 FL=1